MGLCGSYGVGQYSAITTEAHHAIWSRVYKPAGTARPVLWLHSAGAGNVGQAALEPALATNNTLPLLQAITALGLPVLSADCGRDGAGGASTVNWGNDTAQSRVTDMRAFAQSSVSLKASSGKAILVGVSMGATLALNWARANPTLVQAIVLLYPAVNLQAVHDGTGGAAATAAATEAAYGGSLAGFNAAVAAHDPAQHAASYTGVPIYMGYSDSDTVVGTANQTSFISAVGGSALTPRVYAGAAHADMTKPSPSDLYSWLSQYA